MAKKQIRKAVWTGTFRLCGITIRAAVLDNGERVIDAESLLDLFNAMADETATIDTAELEKFARWQTGDDA